MTIVAVTLTLAGLLPFCIAWRANRTTSLAPAVGWAALAWLGWGGALAFGRWQTGFVEERYVALCLTGAAGVAVLGARRPYAGAWNFVVLGLLGVLLLPLAESAVLGTDPADPLRVFFLAATLAVGIVNYLPTRFAMIAVLLGVACAREMTALYVTSENIARTAGGVLPVVVFIVPWVAWMFGHQPRANVSEFDWLWLDFRDRFGALWGQRVRDHFNQAAKNAGWPVTLGWGGLTRHGETTAQQDADMMETLRAVLKRFL